MSDLNQTVWKYIVRPTIQMPQGAQILTFQIQEFQPAIWVLVNPDAPMETRSFEIVGTGWSLGNRPRRFVGTWQQDMLVWHVFELTDVSN